ncbi:MAG: CHAT domain-containing protein [Proteobacteria bacterium]|nr:CHAT domain-containing protein [Pseudomonadota bacterium]
MERADAEPGAAAADAALDEARRWIAGGGTLPADPAEALRVARAIKDLCYAAWSSEPQFAGRAAQALERLRDHAAGGATQRQIAALAHWTRAIAQLAGGDMAGAIDSLDAAAAGFVVAGCDAEAAQTRVPRIMALSMLGRHDEAVACAEDAQRRFVVLGDRRSAAKTSLNLGSLHLRHDEYAAAAHHYRQASVLFARIADREHSVMADIGIADASTALGEIDEAARLYARARMRAATHGLPVLEAVADESMALLDLARGRYAEALAGFEQARRRYEALAMPQHLAIAEKQLADAYLELRLLPEALALYEPALARMQALGMPDDAAWTLAQRGRAQALVGRHALAGASFDAAAAGFAAQENPVGRAAVQLARAELALAQGDAAHAERTAADAARGFADAGLVSQRLRADATRAQALLRQGRPARTLFAELLDAAGRARLLGLEVRCLVGSADAALAEGDESAARAAYRQAIERFEEQRAALPGDDVRIAFLTDHLRPYEALLGLALRDHLQAPSAQHAAEVLRWLDRTRARALDERLAQGRPDAAAAEAAPEGIALRAQVHWLTRRLQQQQDDGIAPAELDAARRRAEDALLEHARRERLVRVRDTGPAATADIACALPGLLQADEALVEYGVADATLFACIVRRDGIEVRRALAPIDAVRQAVQAARFQIETLRHGAERWRGHLERLASRAHAHLLRLHALLWAPLADALADVGRVIVVAPGDLAGVPFAALDDGHGALAERHLIASAPSARYACQALGRLPQPARRAVVVGETGRLAHTQTEVRAVAACFGDAVLLQGADATAAGVQQLATGADVLHLACHAEFRADNPMFSALHLDDAPLTAERIETLQLPPGIVVLSACETGLSVGGAGDEHLGLVRAFFVAGAARVLASLWPVDDAVTARFMATFYDALTAGRAPAVALQQAQRDVRRAHPHPYFWAAFALYGGW